MKHARNVVHSLTLRLVRSPYVSPRPAMSHLLLTCLLAAAWQFNSNCDADNFAAIGVAEVDITPNYPIRLSGYGNRTSESEGVQQRIWAKALAIGSDQDRPVILITVDNCGVPWSVTKRVTAVLNEEAGIPPERVGILSSHTHCAPMLSGVLPLIFGRPIPTDQRQRIEQYTAELTAKLQQVAQAALRDRRPGKLAWTVGNVPFAINRRSQKVGRQGPVDHSLPVLRVTDPEGNLRALLVRYTCHAVTLFGDFNRICGDWPGYAQQALQRDHPGCIAMMAIGCAGDQKPNLQSQLSHAQQHGEAIAAEVNRLLTENEFQPVENRVRAKLDVIQLPFDTLPTNAQWVERAQRNDRDGYHARVQLERIQRGEQLPTELSYPIQTWTFGQDLAMVNLSGEVVVDYEVRLDREFDRSRLWINAYANDVPCYIPSRQDLAEGGYEPDRSMRSYDRPASFAPDVEDHIVDTIQRLLPPVYYSAEKQLEYPPPKTPEASRRSITTRQQLQVELVASEPLVVDPVAIDFGVDGRLWVAEYLDYPTGLDENYLPGGRIKYLTDTDGDGRYDKATVLADAIPYPTGLMEWRGGVLIATAPDILYLKDGDGDGQAEIRQILFTGFETDNYQARVNGFRFGLDHLVHGSSGRRAELIHLVDRIAGTATSRLSTPPDGHSLELGSRDFRMDPDAGTIEPVSGGSQNARIRDDWGNWFGSTAGSMLFHYPLVERYLGRNPAVSTPNPQVLTAQGGESAMQLFPTSRTLLRFNNPLHFNHVTSACGPEIYRAHLFSMDDYGDAFICEPVHNLVTRRKLVPDGSTFRAVRAPDETNQEFLASSDNWFRPVQLRTGPDGALWVVDMYRFVIEHPRWIGPERLRRLDVRAGADRGRIYRIYPHDSQPDAMDDLESLSTEALSAAIDHSTGTRRDLIHRELIHRADDDATPELRRVVATGKHPAARLQALCVLDGLRALNSETLKRALTDESPGVRRHAIRLSEDRLAEHPEVARLVLAQVDTSDTQIRAQLAMSLGQWNDPRAGKALARLAGRQDNDEFLRSAILSSSAMHLDILISSLIDADRGPDENDLLGQLIRTALANENYKPLARVFRYASSSQSGHQPGERWQLIAEVLDQLQRDGKSLANLRSSVGRELRSSIDALRPVFAAARVGCRDDRRSARERIQAIQPVGRGLQSADDLRLLLSLLEPQQPSQVQSAALTALARNPDPTVISQVFGKWRQLSPATRRHALQQWLRRQQSLRVLLAAIMDGELPISDFDASQRAFLVNHVDRQIQQQARELFGDRQSARHEVVQEYQTALGLAGSTATGRQVFDKHCAKCHRLDDQGKQIGPDLASSRNRSPEELLIAIFDPNRAVEPRYQAYVCATTDGRVLTGTLVSESATSVTLLASEGETQVILRSDIEQLQSTGKSLMPEGVEKDLTGQDVAHLLAYLQASQNSRKILPSNEPVTVRSGANGVLHLLPSSAAIYGPTLTIGQPVKRVDALTDWNSKNDRAVWEVQVPSDSRYEVWLDCMCDEGTAGNEFVVQAARVTDAETIVRLPARTISTAGEENWYRSRNVGSVSLTEGKHRITVRSQGELTGPLFHLRAITLVPKSR